MTCAATLEKKVSLFIRKRLKIHLSTTDICLYSPISPCPMPLKSLTNVLRSSKISGHLVLRDSKHPLVSSANPNIQAGLWDAKTSSSIAEAELNFLKMRGPANFSQQGVGIIKALQIPPKQSHAYRKLVSSTSQKIKEEQDTDRALKLKLQCHWMSWQNYVQNNLSWKNILALPPNLLSFCISSTYNVLPSPSNLRRWNTENDPSCTLCGKQLCTIAHILGACKFSLEQGRFTFRHDSVLSYLVSVINAFLKEVKPVKSKKSNNIHFIKSGTKPPKTKTNPTGIFHLASDWVLISDLGPKYVFPFQIALTELRPDIVIFSKALRRVVLLELTCPCEENMTTWHATKLSKYSTLLEAIRNNKWYVDLFAVEVGARGYPSTSVKRALQKLGFSNRLSNKTVKTLGRISMECSFFIWIHRNTKEWSKPTVTNNTNLNEENQLRPKQPHLTNAQNHSKPKTTDSTSPKHAGFINKGNTCYINAILQVLSVLPSFWCQQSSQSGIISPLIKAFTLNLSLIKKRSSPIDPSNFLRAFQNTISNKRGTPFNINTQQDVPEILQILLDELKGSSPISDGIISSSLLTTTTCDTCFSSSSKEDKHQIISLSLSNSLSSSLQHLMEPEYLKDDNKWFCNMCNQHQVSVRDCKFVKCGNIIILQLNRYANVNGTLVKDNRKVKCLSSQINIPVYIDEHLSVNRKFNLKATINHSGTINAGHYWAFIKGSDGNWLKCNDTSVVKASFKDLSNHSSYLFIYSDK